VVLADDMQQDCKHPEIELELRKEDGAVLRWYCVECKQEFRPFYPEEFPPGDY
jgi:hypothetical protein